MTHLRDLVSKAKAGEVDAFGAIVRRFQDMAVGYAWSLLRDFHLAEDAAQQAFIDAHAHLPELE